MKSVLLLTEMAEEGGLCSQIILADLVGKPVMSNFNDLLVSLIKLKQWKRVTFYCKFLIHTYIKSSLKFSLYNYQVIQFDWIDIRLWPPMLETRGQFSIGTTFFFFIFLEGLVTLKANSLWAHVNFNQRCSH